jgi:SAM-dependent methyltransferase
METITMQQDRIFLDREGDNWFTRNSLGIENKKDKFDWPSYLIDLIEDKSNIKKIAELGCSNGWRLQKLQEKYPELELSGIDPSVEAIEDGRKNFPNINLSQGLLSEVPFKEEFDIVIVYFVLHWVDRPSLAKSIAEVDRVVRDGGFLIIGDFLPDHQQKTPYHHVTDEDIFTYKQDYPAIFESLGIYRELAKFSNDYASCSSLSLQSPDSSMRCSCSILQKSLTGFYHK